MDKNRLLTLALVVFFVLINIGMAFAQAQEGQEVEQLQTPEIPVIGESKPYTLGKEDVVEITVQNQTEFSGRFAIGPSGEIQYAYLGDIQAEGLTKEQLKQVLVSKLARFVKVPLVSVTIAEYLSKNVYIIGEVYSPGKYPMMGDTLSLRDALFEADLPTREAALKRSYIVKSGTNPAVFRKVNLLSILYKGGEKDNIDLVPGDIVVVPSTVPSVLNRALANILSPFSSARDADVLLEHRFGAGSEYDD